MRQQDVRHGQATVVVDSRGGWALPGCLRTDDQQEALVMAARIDRILAQLKTADRVADPEPVRVTRRPAKNALWLVSLT